MSIQNPLSKLAIPANSFLLSNNNKFIGVVQGSRFKKLSGDTPTPEEILSSLEEVSAVVDSLADSLAETNAEINELETQISEISSATGDIENLAEQIADINDKIEDISALSSIENDVENLAEQVTDINDSLENISSLLSSNNLDKYFPLSGGVTVSGDIAFDGNIVKINRNSYPEIRLIEETDTTATFMLSVDSASFLVKNANSINDIFTDDSCEFSFKIKKSGEDLFEEQEVASTLYGEDVFGNRFVIVSFSENVNSIRIQESIENNDVQIFAFVNDSAVILKTLPKDQINVSYEYIEESSNVATEKDISALKEELSGHFEDKLANLDQVFVEKDKDIYVRPGKNIYQMYDNGLNQKYITAKDLNGYDAFWNVRDQIDQMSELSVSTHDADLIQIVNRLNEILTILKNN